MNGMGRRVWQAMLILLATAAVGTADTTNMPPPGTLNYVEGQVLVEGHKESPKSVGTAYLKPGQVLSTGDGNVEVLLTPGVYLRLGDDSAVKMISPRLADTQVQLTAGSAILEVDELFKENDVSVVVDRATTRIEKEGLYDFNANTPSVKVLDGKAIVSDGDQRVKLTKGHEVLLSDTQPLRKQKYQKEAVENDPLYRWSKLRSEYASQSNVDAGNALMTEGGWFGPGWYWDPFWYDFAFLPGYGMFWGPFGSPFFAPAWVGLAPYYGYYPAYAGYYHYPAMASNRGHGVAQIPRLAPHPTPGAAGYRPIPRAAGPSAMGRAPMMRGMGRIGGGGFHSFGGIRGGFGRGR